MADHLLRWFYSFDDPYCYIAWPAAERIAEQFTVTLLPIPLAPAPGADDPQHHLRIRYRLRDARRMAEHHEMKFSAVEPVSPMAARRMACVVEGARALKKDTDIITAGFSALWGAGENFDNVEAVRAVCDEAGIAWDTARAWIDNPDIEKRLAENRALLGKLGHYDTDMFEFTGGWYWGVDRIEYLIDDLTVKGLKKG